MQKKRRDLDQKHATSSARQGGGCVTAWVFIVGDGTGSLVFYCWCEWQKEQESLHFNHIWIASFPIHCAGVQGQNYKLRHCPNTCGPGYTCKYVMIT